MQALTEKREVSKINHGCCAGQPMGRSSCHKWKTFEK